MDIKIAERIEDIEERIENIKWLIGQPIITSKSRISNTVNTIRKSAGILGKAFPGGTVFENKTRKEWRGNFFKRIRLS